MIKPSTQIPPLALGLLFAAFFWYVMFRLSPFNFWAEMTFSTVFLGGFAIWRLKSTLTLRDLGTVRAWALGIASAVCLYLVFWVGKSLSSWILSSSPREISDIYSYRAQGEPWVILLLLLFVIGPCEEIFWRGFVQSSLSKTSGKVRGFLIASALYGLVHVWAGNLMLLVAAFTCGLFWGWLYLKQEKLASVIISHALWDALVFVVLPLQ
jgi:membrane protease YdiL (CAAX protease family)